LGGFCMHMTLREERVGKLVWFSVEEGLGKPWVSQGGMGHKKLSLPILVLFAQDFFELNG